MVIKNDPIVNLIIAMFRIKKTQRNYHLTFAFIYNFIPAFVFAPYIFYLSRVYFSGPLLLIAVAIFVVDAMHFYRAVWLTKN